MDAESETLVNSALASLLQGSNTTISIAHRLSTIKRADTIIVLSADGKVAEQGPYSVLSKDPHGAFTKLMEWQMHGGETSLPLNPTRLVRRIDTEDDEHGDDEHEDSSEASHNDVEDPHEEEIPPRKETAVDSANR